MGIGAGLFVGGAAMGQTYGEQRVAELLTDVGIEQHLEAQLPLEAAFTGTDGEAIELGSAFDGSVPVILTLNYFDCPQLCSLQLSNLAAAMGTVGLDLGTDYRVVTLSIDPNDTPARMSELRDRYIVNYLDASKEAGEKRDADQAKAGWVCLTGTKVQIDRVAETAGFGYAWIDEKQEYAHQAANILCSPSGQIMRYLEGVDPSLAGVLRLSLVEASEGKVGSLYDGIFLNCFIYDSSTGQYTPAVMQLLKVAAALTVLAVVTGFFFMKRGEAQHVVAGSEGTCEGDAASASEKTS
jgi:protein SCO1/2